MGGCLIKQDIILCMEDSGYDLICVVSQDIVKNQK